MIQEYINICTFLVRKKQFQVLTSVSYFTMEYQTLRVFIFPVYLSQTYDVMMKQISKNLEVLIDTRRISWNTFI